MKPEANSSKFGIRTVTVKRQEIRLGLRPGKGQRPPLLLLNGIGANLELFRPLVDALDQDLEVICFDVPGVGGSPTPLVPYRFSTLAWLIRDLLDKLGHQQVDVLGVSWGGGLAQQFAFQFPKRCRRLILVSTGTGMLMVPGSLPVLSKMITPRRYIDPDYLLKIAPDLYGGSLRLYPELASEFAKGIKFRGKRGYLYQLLATWGWTSLPWLPFFSQPTLILAGSEDPIIPLINARIMNFLIPKSRLHIFNDGHLGLLTGVTELAPVLEQFLTEEDS